METIIKITNHKTELVSESQLVIGVGFAMHGPFELLNNCSIEYSSLTTEQQELTDQFINLMKSKMFSCPEGGADDGTGGES